MGGRRTACWQYARWKTVALLASLSMLGVMVSVMSYAAFSCGRRSAAAPQPAKPATQRQVGWGEEAGRVSPSTVIMRTLRRVAPWAVVAKAAAAASESIVARPESGAMCVLKLLCLCVIPFGLDGPADEARALVRGFSPTLHSLVWACACALHNEAA